MVWQYLWPQKFTPNVIECCNVNNVTLIPRNTGSNESERIYYREENRADLLHRTFSIILLPWTENTYRTSMLVICSDSTSFSTWHGCEILLKMRHTYDTYVEQSHINSANDLYIQVERYHLSSIINCVWDNAHTTIQFCTKEGYQHEQGTRNESHITIGVSVGSQGWKSIHFSS